MPRGVKPAREVIRVTFDLEPELARTLRRMADVRGVGARVIVEEALRQRFEWLRQQGRDGREPEI